MIAIASTYKYKGGGRSRYYEHFEHEYVLVELIRKGDGSLWWVPLQGELADEFSQTTALRSLEYVQGRYGYPYVGQLKHGEKPFNNGDLGDEVKL